MKRPELTEKSIQLIADIKKYKIHDVHHADLIIEDALEMYSDYIETIEKLIR